MENKCSITMKEARGDTIKEHIMRFGGSNADTSMLDAYMKYEDKMIIEKIYEPIGSEEGIAKVTARAKQYFRWNSPRFIKQFLKITWQKFAAQYNNQLIGGLFTMLYLLHWVFYQSTSTHFLLSGFIHLSLILLVFGLVVFNKQESGSIEKENISRDLETNVIG
jgi:hypothetical protein